MKVLVKSWKNLLNSMIRAIKPIKMPILSLNGHWILIILFITATFLTKMTINDARSQKNHHLFGYIEIPMFTRLTAHQIVVHEGCFKGKPCHKKLQPPRLSTTSPTSLWWSRSNVQQIRNRKKKVTLCFSWNTARSLCRRFNMLVQLHFLNFVWEST